MYIPGRVRTCSMSLSTRIWLSSYPPELPCTGRLVEFTSAIESPDTSLIQSVNTALGPNNIWRGKHASCAPWKMVFWLIDYRQSRSIYYACGGKKLAFARSRTATIHQRHVLVK